jgi:phospholipid transport system substrate-binding protein
MSFVSLRRGIVICGVILAITLGASLCQAGEPTKELKQTVDQMISILSNKKLSVQQKHEKIYSLMDKSIDWDEVAKRVLGIHWRRRTPEEREKFKRLFKDFVEAKYAKRFEMYSGEKVFFGKEIVEGNYASVTTKIETKQNRTFTLENRMVLKNGRWLVYDILIEGISMVNNYRTQINNIIARRSFKGLIKILEKKAAQKK